MSKPVVKYLSLSPLDLCQNTLGTAGKLGACPDDPFLKDFRLFLTLYWLHWISIPVFSGPTSPNVDLTHNTQNSLTLKNSGKLRKKIPIAWRNQLSNARPQPLFYTRLRTQTSGWTWAKIIVGGKLRNPYIQHIFSYRRYKKIKQKKACVAWPRIWNWPKQECK